MKRLSVICLCVWLSGCAVVRRHPLATGALAGAAIGTTVAILTRQTCPKTINGVPYDGTPPCPKYWPPDKWPTKK